MDYSDADRAFAASVGQRLRTVRRSKAWSLDEVEDRSEGRWSASAVGAYERGFRNLSLPRLRELADFYGVAMSSLLGEESGGHLEPVAPLRVDLAVLASTPAARSITEYLQAVARQRSVSEARDLPVRSADVPTLCALLGTSQEGLLDRLADWGALSGSRPPAPPAGPTQDDDSAVEPEVGFEPTT